LRDYYSALKDNFDQISREKALLENNLLAWEENKKREEEFLKRLKDSLEKTQDYKNSEDFEDDNISVLQNAILLIEEIKELRKIKQKNLEESRENNETMEQLEMNMNVFKKRYDDTITQNSDILKENLRTIELLENSQKQLQKAQDKV
jgi:hypothetical protein